MDLAVAIVRIKHELREKLKEVRQAAPVPPYVVSSILAELQNDLKEEEKELLTVLLLQAEEKADKGTENEAEAKEIEDAEDIILDNDREPSEE